MELRKEEDMKKLWVIALLLVGCSTTPNGKYETYTNVSYYYDNELHYVVEIPNTEKKYVIDIDYVFFVKRGDVRIDNKFYLGSPSKLVIYRENH